MCEHLFGCNLLLDLNKSCNKLMLYAAKVMSNSLDDKKAEDEDFNLGVLKLILKNTRDDMMIKLSAGKSQADIYNAAVDDLAKFMDIDDDNGGKQDNCSDSSSNSDDEDKRMSITKAMLANLASFKI